MQGEGEKEIKFEEALEKLEKITEELENGNLGLDETIKKFEEGVQLFKLCKKKLQEAELKIEKLMEELK
ncbi:MAG: exodeoxyribonuclease VII small subunit [Thermoplasmata archaeon]|nr:MAG: exodeoxyribonuclease VII small subunit [Thermoplasmata archaeon]RLF50987.1 MAG: exodeoxyribonuclease VII small subunit [Thermoplasmata archaeon]